MSIRKKIPLDVSLCMSYQNGAIACEQYEKMNGPYFSDFAKRNFRQMICNSVNPNRRLFVQDGDPSQNLRAAARSIEKTRGQQISIPPRSTGLNLLKTFFI